MTVYSHSRLSCFEDCPQKFKFRYIDKVETEEEEETVERFLGVRVHKALELLYFDVMHQKFTALDDVLVGLRQDWKAQWSADIKFIRKGFTEDNYKRMAEKYVTDYYRRYSPFTQTKTIGLEAPIMFNLDKAGKYRLKGYIDRLAEGRDGYYEIHDYKTGRMSAPEALHKDRQLALYMLGVKHQYTDTKHVRLIWHFLAFDKELDSTRTDAQLEMLRQQTIKLIETIEAEERYRASPGSLCSWCEYQSLCGQWSHKFKVMEEPAKYNADSGVKLVNKYAELKSVQRQMNKAWDEQLDELEAALLAYAKKEKIDAVFGTTHKIRIKDSERLVFPGKNTEERERLEALLRKHRKLSEVSQLDTTALGRILADNEWDGPLTAALRGYVDVERKKRLFLSKSTEEDSAD